MEETELAQLEHLLEQRSKRLYFQGLRAAGELPGRLAAQHPALAPLPDKARRRLLQVLIPTAAMQLTAQFRSKTSATAGHRLAELETQWWSQHR